VLAGHRLADWPFPGRVAVKERHAEGRLDEVHVFERWSHLGTARSEGELGDLAAARAEIDFDPDVYSILRTYMARHAKSVRPIEVRAQYDEAA
jgi:DNA polymerase-3 subunit epsilon